MHGGRRNHMLSTLDDSYECFWRIPPIWVYFKQIREIWQTNEICDVIVAHVYYVTLNFRLATFCYGSFSLLAHAIDSALDPKNWSTPCFLIKTKICNMCPKSKVHIISFAIENIIEHATKLNLFQLPLPTSKCTTACHHLHGQYDKGNQHAVSI